MEGDLGPDVAEGRVSMQPFNNGDQALGPVAGPGMGLRTMGRFGVGVGTSISQDGGVGGLRERYSDGKGGSVEIRNVWASNLEEEMSAIREIVNDYPYVAMDTEFPGVVARPIGDFNRPDYQYQTLRCNVDMLKIIQLGLSFANSKGDLPESCCTWQFNFAFCLKEDMYAHDSIELLKNSGIDFDAHESRGIDVHHFGELLMTSGLVLLPNVHWISFHSGYDFGYLLKILTCQDLPQQESEFFELLQLYFPKLFDIKFLISSREGFHGGLNKLAEDLKVSRIGPMHQAGSDSLLTEQVFLKMADVSFNGLDKLDSSKFCGQLYGYGGNLTTFRRPPNSNNKPQSLHNGVVGRGGTGGVSTTSPRVVMKEDGNSNDGEVTPSDINDIETSSSPGGATSDVLESGGEGSSSPGVGGVDRVGEGEGGEDHSGSGSRTGEGEEGVGNEDGDGVDGGKENEEEGSPNSIESTPSVGTSPSLGTEEQGGVGDGLVEEANAAVGAVQF